MTVTNETGNIGLDRKILNNNAIMKSMQWYHNGKLKINKVVTKQNKSIIQI